MNKKGIVRIFLFLSIIVGILYIFRPTVLQKQTVAPMNLKLTSPVFVNYQKIPSLYTCDGTKIHPPLVISGAPVGTKSFIIMIDDPDAPNGTFNHWVIWNIHPDTTAIPAGVNPTESQEGINSAGTPGYSALCPQTGQHRYFFTLYAMDTKLGLDGKATKTDIEKLMSGHVLSQTLLVGVVQLAP
jgi:Raf kinase inhibitor-like YbhB/YbcL family protein